MGARLRSPYPMLPGSSSVVADFVSNARDPHIHLVMVGYSLGSSAMKGARAEASGSTDVGNRGLHIGYVPKKGK